LTLNMRETQKKKSEANYLMDVVEAYVDDCDCIRFADSFTSPHVIIFALSTDDKLRALERIETARRKIETKDWACPVILLAYHAPNSGSVPYDIMRQLKELSKNANVFRCMETNGLGRNLLRHCFAVALMAARPFLAKTRAENDVCIYDEKMEKLRDKPRKPKVEQECPKIEAIQNKSPFKKSCRIQ
uniref:Ras-associating domain-containing protein n=1 Tax=Heligmosomoides polygyrus TaxID=6339 RepID=A0A183F4X5_HELPZ